ncbi:MAG: twin-arginine translocase TatA/TatE family subunit [Rhodospirillaceae bacterium]|nr:twin-arginine translocase TatA/TatE family subunit [Rhodospirillaceae bacterium]
MGAFSIWHWLIVLAVVLVLFGGKGKISALMGDFGKGLKSFKKGMKDEEGAASSDEDEAPKALNTEKAETANESTAPEKKNDAASN